MLPDVFARPVILPRSGRRRPGAATWSRRTFGLALALAACVGLACFRSEDSRPGRPTAGERVIAFGDSLVEGVGASPGRDFVSVVSRRLRVPIVNAGRRGDTTRSALSRLEGDVLSRNPRLVIVLLGGNDVLRRIPREETFRNLETIVSRIRQRGAAVVLVGLDVGLFSNAYSREYDSLARRTAAGLVPDVLDGILGRADRMSDAIHPNDRGYELMADRIEPVVRELVQ